MSSLSAANRRSGSGAKGFVPGRPRNARVFWLGVLVLTAGVFLQTGEFLAAHATGLKSPVTGTIGMAGMLINLVGLALAVYGILPAGLFAGQRANDRELAAGATGAASATIGVSAVAALDAVGLTGTHWWMMARLFIGLILDTMKPATIAFMLPGLRAEYHLAPAQASLLPLFALTGTTIGSVLFGRMGDWIGRRSSFVLTALFLAATAFCGLMNGFAWQVGLCFIMGLAAGGELPLIYAMIVEMMPARHRGWSSVVIGGVGGLCGYLIASLCALVLEPAFGWRVLWLPNLPTALMMLALVGLIPESPRLLLHTGHADEARAAMAAMGVKVGQFADSVGAAVERRRTVEVFQGPLLGTTLTLGLYGFAYGLFNWGFITWLPTMLRDVLHYDPTFVTRLLATSALFALPGTVAAAALYSFWSSRGATVIFAVLTGAVVALFGLAQPVIATRPDLITVAVILLLITSSSMIGVLAPYSAELYPTMLRGAGSGVVAASSKAGGIVGPPIVGALLTIAIGTGLLIPSLAVSVPLVAAGLVMVSRGVETRGRRLEELTQGA